MGFRIGGDFVRMGQSVPVGMQIDYGVSRVATTIELVVVVGTLAGRASRSGYPHRYQDTNFG